MKLEKTREYYLYYAGKTSEIVRQLGLAGVALVWVFRGEAGGSVRLPRLLLWAGLLIVAGLAADLLQYAAGSGLWYWFGRKKEKELFARRQESAAAAPPAGPFDPEQEQFWAPVPITYPTVILFWLKLGLILAAYVLFFIFLARRISLT